jgi:hypothetical protein
MADKINYYTVTRKSNRIFPLLFSGNALTSTAIAECNWSLGFINQLVLISIDNTLCEHNRKNEIGICSGKHLLIQDASYASHTNILHSLTYTHA